MRDWNVDGSVPGKGRARRNKPAPFRRPRDSAQELDVDEISSTAMALPRLAELDLSAQARVMQSVQRTLGNAAATRLVDLARTSSEERVAQVQRQPEHETASGPGAVMSTAGRDLQRRIKSLIEDLQAAQKVSFSTSRAGWLGELVPLGFRLAAAETDEAVGMVDAALGEIQPRILGQARAEATASYGNAWELIVGISGAQIASRFSSRTRSGWLSDLFSLQARLGDAETADLGEVVRAQASFELLDYAIDEETAAARSGWYELEERYLAERDRLSEETGKAGVYAREELDSIYDSVRRPFDAGVLDFLVDEDYSRLDDALHNRRYIWWGEVRAARERSESLLEMLDVVEGIRYSGEDEDKIVPGWDDRLFEERDRLALLSDLAPTADLGSHFRLMSEQLWVARDRTLDARPRAQGLAEKGFLLGKGALSAAISPFVEAVKQLYDLEQITLHFLTYGQYEPQFVSDVAEEARQGKSTGQIVRAMAMGVIETPGRWLDAVRQGDYEAIGRETVNLYGMAKKAKGAPRVAARFRTMLRWSKARRLAAGEGGIDVHSAYQALQQAKTQGFVYRVRPVEKAVVRWREQGHAPKPAYLEMKTIKQADVHLGASASEVGLVGFFEPRLPANLGRLSRKVQQQVLDRYGMRKREVARLNDEVARLEAQGLIERQGNTIVDARTGKAFTGDYDIWDITDKASGAAAPPEAWRTLEGGPFKAQHGALEAWDIPPGKAAKFAELVLEARPGGKIKLIEFHPDGTIRYATYKD